MQTACGEDDLNTQEAYSKTARTHDKVTDVGRYSGCVNANKILIMSEKHYDLK